MPIFEPTVLQSDQIKLRHIGPRAAVWPTSPAQDATVLGRTDMVARPLAISNVPANPDFASGSWTTRLDDSGECSFVFPNTTSSDGVPWRERFDPDGHNQFLEVTYNGNLEGVFCIDTVTPTQQSVTVHGQDGWFLLKKAYERDWIVVQAPRDVIERGTQVWVPVTVDNFSAGALNAQWTPTESGGASASIGAAGGLVLSTPASASNVTVNSSTNPATGCWRAVCQVQYFGGPVSFNGELIFLVGESNGDQYAVAVTQGAGEAAFGVTLILLRHLGHLMLLPAGATRAAPQWMHFTL